jgi:glycosyltransferase 2 family protein
MFLAKALKDNWQDITHTHLQVDGLGFLAAALGMTLIAHGWAGWVWSWILQEFNQSIAPLWGVRAYLKTNVAKYIPGNIWHYYGRITIAKTAGIPLGVATLSVLLEPMLMAASAIIFAVLGGHYRWSSVTGIVQGQAVVSLIVLGVGLLGVHPRVLNAILQWGEQVQAALSSTPSPNEHQITLQRYPLKPLIGELLFVGLRGTGFILTLQAFQPIVPEQIWPIYTAFSLAWLLGLIVPGAPGGIGVFEAAAIALLQGDLPTGTILSVVGLYRLISILAEAIGAGCAWLCEHYLAASSSAQ